MIDTAASMETPEGVYTNAAMQGMSEEEATLLRAKAEIGRREMQMGMGLTK